MDVTGNLGVPLGAIAASGMMLLMSKPFATTGWRIAMLLSVVIVIPALFARYKLADSPLYKRLKQQQLAAWPSFTVLQKHLGFVILVALIVAFMHMDGFVTGAAGISYNLSGILGGMIAPSLLAGLIGEDVFHRWYFVPVIYAFYCAVAMLALLFIRETRDVNLSALDQTEAGLPITLRPREAVPDQLSGGFRGPNK